MYTFNVIFWQNQHDKKDKIGPLNWQLQSIWDLVTIVNSISASSISLTRLWLTWVLVHDDILWDWTPNLVTTEQTSKQFDHAVSMHSYLTYNNLVSIYLRFAGTWGKIDKRPPVSPTCTAAGSCDCSRKKHWRTQESIIAKRERVTETTWKKYR